MVIRTKRSPQNVSATPPQDNKIALPSFARFRDKMSFAGNRFLPKNEIEKKHKLAARLKRRNNPISFNEKLRNTIIVLIPFLFALRAIFYPMLNPQLYLSQSQSEMSLSLPFEVAGEKKVLSIVVVTFKKPKALRILLHSIVQQRTSFNFELVVADNGCLEETKNSIESVLNMSDTVSFPLKHLKFCENPGYGMGNNRALRHTGNSKWVLFLNDDVELEEDFLHHMVNLGQRKQRTANVGAVGCKILNSDGTELLEAGSIIWSDGSCYGYGRGRTDIDSSDLMYTRPVDYVSGTCLMVSREHLNKYGGFDTSAYEAYYEDTDMQMRIKYVHNKTIWYQPLAVLRHVEHGSFGDKHSLELMQQGEKVFKLRWKDQLVNHAPYTESLMWRMHASRGPMRFSKNILYIDQWIPDPKLGSGFGRAYDNVKILSELGYFVTAHAVHGLQDCDDSCMYNMQQDSVEIHKSLDLASLLKQRPGFYSYVVVSRPPIWQICMDEIIGYCRNNGKCKIIYDAEAFWFRRDWLFLDAINNGYVSMESIPKKDAITENTRKLQEWEENILSPPDAVIAVSEDEAKHMRLVLEHKGANVHVVGHTMEIKKQSSYTFEDRLGILFLASFNGGMYYNGDAIFYFVNFVYPLILESSTESIPLVIVGRSVPGELKELVNNFNAKNGHKLKVKIAIHDSPNDILPFYEKSRVFVAPHLYGSGIQFKLSEALSRGIPVVVSKMSAEKLALSPEESCIGDSKEEFATCVISVHNNDTYWKSLQRKGLEFISRTHDRKLISRVWQEVISSVE